MIFRFVFPIVIGLVLFSFIYSTYSNDCSWYNVEILREGCEKRKSLTEISMIVIPIGGGLASFLINWYLSKDDAYYEKTKSKKIYKGTQSEECD